MLSTSDYSSLNIIPGRGLLQARDARPLLLAFGLRSKQRPFPSAHRSEVYVGQYAPHHVVRFPQDVPGYEP